MRIRDYAHTPDIANGKWGKINRDPASMLVRIIDSKTNAPISIPNGATFKINSSSEDYYNCSSSYSPNEVKVLKAYLTPTPDPVTPSGPGNTYVTAGQLQELFKGHGHCQAGNVTDDMVKKFNDTIRNYIVDGSTDIDKIEMRIKHFLTQCLHESKVSLTELYNGDPNVYFKNIQGGAKYRGAGFIQLTHKSNYQAFANAIKDQKVVDEGYSYVAKNYAWEAAGFWWKSNGINKMVDDGNTLKQISNTVNRGPGNKNSSLNPNGWEDRQNAYKLVNKVMK